MSSPNLTETEIRATLRAADDIIAEGGRTLLAKILKGSREKKILQLKLNQCPSHGFYQANKLEDVIAKIDWMLDHGLLDIEYNGKLPMIVFTERGWEIERDQRANAFLQEWNQRLEKDESSPDMHYLKDRNRGLILLLLEKIKETGSQKYIPYLQKWEKIDYKKVRTAIQITIKVLEDTMPFDHASAKEREASMQHALKGAVPRDLLLKCVECGKRFLFTIEEQHLFRQKGFMHPRHCQACRDKRNHLIGNLIH